MSRQKPAQWLHLKEPLASATYRPCRLSILPDSSHPLQDHQATWHQKCPALFQLWGNIIPSCWVQLMISMPVVITVLVLVLIPLVTLTLLSSMMGMLSIWGSLIRQT